MAVIDKRMGASRCMLRPHGGSVRLLEGVWLVCCATVVVVGEACLYAGFIVGRDGRVNSVTADPESDQECAETALLGLCVPTFVELAGGEATACGI